MDINQLKYFITVAQTLNFSEAARRHKITQPSISHHINELEKRVGVKLFLRDKRRVTLGCWPGIAAPCHKIVQAAQNALLKARQAEENAAGHISISAVTAASEV